MKAKITVFLIALAIIFTGTDAQARVVKKEQSWIDRIFSNDSSEMVQKSPFGQPQPRVQNGRYQRPQNQPYKTSEESRTQTMKTREAQPRRLGRHTAENTPAQTRSQRVQGIRQQRMKAMRDYQAANSGIND